MIGRMSICRTPLHYLGMLRPTLRSTQLSPLAAQRLKHDTGDSGEEPSAKGRPRLRQVKLIEVRRGSGKGENPIRDGATTSGLRTKSVGLESEEAKNEPMGEAKDEPMSEAKDEVFNEAKEVALMSASKDEPMSEAKNEPMSQAKNEPMSQAKNEPMSEAKNEPMSEAKNEPMSEAKNEPMSQAKNEPISEAKNEPMSQAKNEPMSEAKNEPMSQAKNEPMSYARDEPISEAKNDVFSEAKKVAFMSATKDEPISEAKNEPLCEAKDEAFTGAQHEPMAEAKDSPRSEAQDEAFTTEIPQERRQESPFESRPELPMERQPALPAKTSPGEVNPKNPYHIVTCEQEQDTEPSNAEVPEGKVKVSGTIIFKDSSNFETKSLEILANVPTPTGESLNVWSQSCAPEKEDSGAAKNVNDTKDEEAQIILEFDADTSTTKGNMDLKVNASKTEEILNSDTQNKIDEKQATIEDLYPTTPKGYEIGCVVDLSDIVQSTRDEQNVEAIVPETENLDDKIQISSSAETTNRLPRTIVRKTDDSPAKAVEAVNEEQAVEAIVPGTENLDDKIQTSSTAVDEEQAVEKVETIENPEEIAIKSPTNRLPRMIVRKKDDSPIQTPTNRLPIQWINEDGSPAKVAKTVEAVNEEQAVEAIVPETENVDDKIQTSSTAAPTNRLPRTIVKKTDDSPAKAVEAVKDELSVKAVVPETENVDDKMQISSTAVKEEQAAEAVKKVEAIVPESPEEIVIKSATNRLPHMIVRKKDDSPAKAEEAVNEEQAVESSEEVEIIAENSEAFKSPSNTLPLRIVRDENDFPVEPVFKQLIPSSEFKTNRDAPPEESYSWKDKSKENIEFIQTKKVFKSDMEEELAAPTSMDLSPEKALKKVEVETSEAKEFKSEMNELQSETKELQMEMNELQSEAKELQMEMNELQSETTELQSEMNELQSEATEEKSESTEVQNTPKSAAEIISMMEQKHKDQKSMILANRSHDYPSKSTSQIVATFGLRPEPGQGFRAKGQLNRTELDRQADEYFAYISEPVTSQRATKMEPEPSELEKKMEPENSELAKSIEAETSELDRKVQQVETAEESNRKAEEYFEKIHYPETSALEPEIAELMKKIDLEQSQLEMKMEPETSELGRKVEKVETAEESNRKAEEYFEKIHYPETSALEPEIAELMKKIDLEQSQLEMKMEPETSELGRKVEKVETAEESNRKADEYFAKIHDPETSALEPEIAEFMKKIDLEQSQLEMKMEPETSELGRKVEKVETAEESNRKAEEYFEKIHYPETSALEPEIAEFMKKIDLEQSQLEMKMEPETSELGRKVEKVETPEESNRKADEYFAKINKHTIPELEPEISKFMETSNLPKKILPDFSKLYKKFQKVETPEESERKAEEYFAKISAPETSELAKKMEPVKSELAKKIEPEKSELTKKKAAETSQLGRIVEKVETPEESERKAEEYFAKISAPEISELANKMELEKSELANKMEPEKSELANKMEPEKSELTKKKAAESSQLGRKVEKVETPEEANRKAEEYFAKINDQETSLDRQVEESRRTTFEEMFVNSKSSQYFNEMNPKQETYRLKRNETSKKVEKGSHLDTKLDQAIKDMALNQKAEEYFDIINEAELSQLEGKMEPESSQLDKKMNPETPQEEESRSFEELTTKFVVRHGGEKEEADEKSMKRNRDDAIADKQGDDTNEEPPSDKPLFVPPEDKDRLKEKSELSEGDLYKKQSEDPVSDDAAEFSSNSEPEKRPAPERKRKRKLADGELDVKLLVPDEAKETASGTSPAIDAPAKQNFVQYIVEKIFRKKKPPPKGRTMSTCCQSRDVSTSCALLCPDNNDIFDDPFSPEEGKTIDPNDKDFISPDLERQGLGARAIRTDREENRKHGQPQAMKIDNPVGVWSTKKTKTPLNHQPGMSMSTMLFSSDSDSTKIRGGSKQCKNREKTMREKLMEKKENKDNKIEIMGGSEQCAEKLQKLKDGSEDDDCKSSFSSFFQFTKMFWSPTLSDSEPTKKDK
ncbi:titin isoform X2 [Drosophila pseudoobscura]|uniref:Titin isoform X2 n=1 Tax=Drosophila pseudoobscura pseudoobscura TaxID=46245 RepID=A0A6I8W683_DROPS|nr:titin isoform X2 [Drosophila pseudoobscura]